MHPNRRFRDQVLGALQEQVDEFERLTGRRLDEFTKDLAHEGEAEWRNLKRELKQTSRRARKRSGCGRRASFSSGRLDRRERRRRSHRSRDTRHRDESSFADSPEGRAERRRVRRARRRVARRVGFVSHLGSYAFTLGILALVTRSIRVAAIVGLFWGIGLFFHYLFAIWAPSWRDRSVAEEVDSRSPRAVASERAKVTTRSRKSMEDLSASIAKEIRNPITEAKRLVQKMGEDAAADENLAHAERALTELDRVERSISHLLRYARDEAPRPAPISLRAVAEAAAAALQPRAEAAGAEILIDFDTAGPVRGDPKKLGQVLEHLISNALDAFESRAGMSLVSDPMIEIAGGEGAEGHEVWVSIADNGPGIPREDQPRIWNPFYTTKETGKGLGLAVARKTIEAHGGRIDLLADRARGSEFVMRFPKDAPAMGESAFDDEAGEDRYVG